jgi:hypothetical protein
MKRMSTEFPTEFINTEHNNSGYKRNKTIFREVSKMDYDTFDMKSQSSIFLMPKSGHCYNFMEGNFKSGRTVFLVPHVITHRDHSEVIIWRCNWGNICDSKCIYMPSPRIKNLPPNIQIN